MRAPMMSLPFLLLACDSGVQSPSRDVTITPEQNITIMRDAEQGFIDLVVARPSSAGSAELCYSLRLDNADQLVYALATPICTSVFGDEAGTLHYVLACDASTTENTLSLWIHPPSGSAAGPTDFVNPCPAPSEGKPDTWTGGCVERVACLENQDTFFQFSIDAHSR